MSLANSRTTERSWKAFDKYLPYLATGTSTMSKRPRLAPDEPCYIERGRGCRVWDIDGNEYIDFRNALGPVTLGYAFPAVDEAIRRQLDQGIIFGHPALLEGEVAELIVRHIPCAEKVRYLKTGGEAIAAALKVARAATGRPRVVQCGYNGWLNSLAPGSSALPGRRQDAPKGVPADVARLHRSLAWNDMPAWTAYFREHGSETAAAVIAMDYADAGASKAFLPTVRALTAKSGALLIIDEIVTGFRIALGGLHEYCSVDVDMAVFSKGIANGMPLSVLTGKKDLLDVIEEAPNSSTISGECQSLAAAIVGLRTYLEQDVIGHLRERGEQLQQGLNTLFERHDYPLRIVGLPACPIIVSVQDDPASPPEDVVDRFFRAAYRNGVSLYLVTYPNFSHQVSDIDEALDRLDHALGEIAGS